MSETADTTPTPAPAAPPPTNDATGDSQRFQGFRPEALREASTRIDDLIRQERERAGLPNPTPPLLAPNILADPPPPGATPPPEPESPPPPAGDPTAEELRKLREDVARYEQEAKTWRGRYEAETVRERQAREAAEAKLREAEQAQIEADRAAAKARLAEPVTTVPLTAEEMETYGPDLMAVVARHAMATVKPLLDAIRDGMQADLDDIRDQVGVQRQAAAKSAWEGFLDRLTERLPDWRKIDAEPAFKDWLDADDPVYGPGARRKAVDAAAQALDDDRASKVFEQYLTQQGRSESRSRKPKGDSPPPPPPPAAPPGVAVQAEPPGDAPPSLADFAAPGGPAPITGGTPPSNGPRIWSMAEIQSYYRDRAQGQYRNRAQEAERMDREIALAQREGRVRA